MVVITFDILWDAYCLQLLVPGTPSCLLPRSWHKHHLQPYSGHQYNEVNPHLEKRFSHFHLCMWRQKELTAEMLGLIVISAFNLTTQPSLFQSHKHPQESKHEETLVSHLYPILILPCHCDRHLHWLWWFLSFRSPFISYVTLASKTLMELLSILHKCHKCH